jgi:hypothetical protein
MPSRKQVDDMVAALQRAAEGAGVELPPDYARRLVVAATREKDQLGVSRLGSGVVIHTFPTTRKRLPLLFGYADPRGQWYRDGSRHLNSAAAEDVIQPEAIEL